jgi:fatty acid desaturase
MLLIEQRNQRANNKNKELEWFPWEDIITHDSRSDCWVAIHGKVYDLTNFVDRHPGGDVIYDGAGGDCTPMWESYHPLALVKEGPMKKYHIGYVRDYKDFYDWNNKFYYTLKERVEAIVPKENRRSETVMYQKFVIILVFWAFTCYKYEVSGGYLWAILFGLASSQVGVNIMHDGNHKAFSEKKWLNTLAGNCLEIIGSSSVIYKRSHNYGHHGCVNHLELDRAFDTTYPILRLHEGLPYAPIHKYQHIYGCFMYCFVNIGDILGQYDELFWLSNYPVRLGSLSKKAVFVRTVVMLYWFTHTIIVPSITFGYTTAFPIWLVYNMVFGCGYAFFFAVNHWTIKSGFVDFLDTTNNDWGELQVKNSTNFSCHSAIWTWLGGGLNYQIEHHLFPGYIHTRLPEIYEITKKTCKEFGIEYNEYDTFSGAIWGHVQLLKHLGKDPKETAEEKQRQKMLLVSK